MIVVGFVTQASKNIHQDKTIPNVFLTSIKALTVLLSCSASSLSGLESSATLVFHNNDLKMMKQLTLSAFILPYIVFAAMWPLMVFFPKTVLKIWIEDPDMMKLVPRIASVIFYSSIFDPISESLFTLFIVMNNGIFAVIAIAVKNMMLLASGAALY